MPLLLSQQLLRALPHNRRHRLIKMQAPTIATGPQIVYPPIKRPDAEACEKLQPE